MIFDFFPPSKMDDLVRNIAEQISKRYPPIIANSPEQPITQERIAEILHEIFSVASEVLRGQRLGPLGRMKLGSAFKWGLRETGYEEKFVDFAAARLMQELGRPPRL